MKKSYLMGVLFVMSALITLSANAALIGRLEISPGSGIYQAYYDDQLDITWAADANMNGRMDWYTANSWAAGLVIDGVSGWRLPNMDIDNSGGPQDCRFLSRDTLASQAACTDSEYGHLYYYGAGTTHGSGVTYSSPSPFSNIQSVYWSSTTETVGIRGDNAYVFVFSGDFGPLFALKDGLAYAWAVYSGDVGNVNVVPVPAAVWLFGSGLLGLAGVAVRKKAA